MNKCKFVKENGKQCKTSPLKGDNYCFFHSEKTKDQRLEAVQKGGNSIKRNYGRKDEIRLNSIGDVLLLLEHTANDLRQNKTNNKTAVILNFIASTALKAIEARYEEKARREQNRKSNIEIEMEKELYPECDDSSY